MEISVKKVNEETVIAVKGRLDTNSSPEFEKAIVPILNSDEKSFQIDCSGLEYISSSGLRLFLMAQKTVIAKKGTLRLTGLKPEIQEIFNITGFSAIFKIE